MNEITVKTPLKVTVYSDYICPFCYIGYLRLLKLRDEYDLDVDWRFLEIHPDNPPEGKPVTELGYPREHWEALMANLARMAEEEGVRLAERTFTTNSRQALKLAQAVREQQPDAFEMLNRALYEAYFLDRRNIGDPAVLQLLADECGIEPEVVKAATQSFRYEDVLKENQYSAIRMQINGTPTYILGGQVYSGAIPEPTLRQAARQSIQGS